MNEDYWNTNASPLANFGSLSLAAHDQIMRDMLVSSCSYIEKCSTESCDDISCEDIDRVCGFKEEI